MKFKIILSLFTLFTISNSFTQELTNIEKKSLKKEIRKLLKEPIKYKYIKESLKVKESIIKEQSNEISDISSDVNKLQHKLNVARDSISQFTNTLNELKNKPKNDYYSIDDNGLKYRLQIGLYEEYDISSFFNQLKLVSFEKTDDGMFRYLIGNFNTEDEAETFKEAIRKMGVKDAWVSFYLDGKRIPKNE